MQVSLRAYASASAVTAFCRRFETSAQVDLLRMRQAHWEGEAAEGGQQDSEYEQTKLTLQERTRKKRSQTVFDQDTWHASQALTEAAEAAAPRRSAEAASPSAE